MYKARQKPYQLKTNQPFLGGCDFLVAGDRLELSTFGFSYL